MIDRYCITALLFATLTVGQAGETMNETARPSALRSTLDDQQGIAVTIYNDDLALVKDRRRVELPAGEIDLALRDVSAKIQPETALLRSLSGGELGVVEQNFDFDLLTPASLLEKYVGKRVGVIKTHPTTGEETEEEGVVLAASNGVVLRIGDRIETGTPGRIVYYEVPENLRDRPTLTMRLDNPKAGAYEIELGYLTSGLGWRADYVGELAAADNQIDLTGWVTLTNRSGTRYTDATLQLVAGDVHRAPVERGVPLRASKMRAMVAEAAPMEEEALFEYHLYTLGRPTTIADNQSKQVALLRAESVPVEKRYLLKGSEYYYRQSQAELGEKIKVGVFVEFTNDDASRLGMPLPKGVVRIYKDDSKGNAQFVGEDRIDHTPKNERVRLKLGDAFDVTARKRQTDFKKLSGFGPWQYQFESAYEIEIANAKDEPVIVDVHEPIPGDWEIREESLPHEKGDAHTATWRVEVPAEGRTTLSYRVRVRF